MRDEETFIEKLRTIFVSLERYNLEVPQLKMIVYGAVGMIVTAVFAALISLVLRK